MQISVSKQIHADLAHQHGFLGEGIGIAYLDTGLFPHKDFSPHSTRIAKFVDFVPVSYTHLTLPTNSRV